MFLEKRLVPIGLFLCQACDTGVRNHRFHLFVNESRFNLHFRREETTHDLPDFWREIDPHPEEGLEEPRHKAHKAHHWPLELLRRCAALPDEGLYAVSPLLMLDLRTNFVPSLDAQEVQDNLAVFDQTLL